MLVVASVLGIWGAVAGPGMDVPGLPPVAPILGCAKGGPLPAWGLHAPEDEEAAPEADSLWPAARLGLERPPGTPPPPARLLPSQDEPDVSSIERGLSRLHEIRAEPRFFPGLTSVLLFPATLASEGLGWLLLPHSITINGQTLFDRDASREDLGSIFVRTFIEREVRFLAGLPGTYVATMNVELGLTEFDRSLYSRLQSRVIFDSLKRSYKERYHVPSMDLDTLVDTLTTGEWVDFLVVPAFVSVYAARYGIDRKWKPCDHLKIQVHIEKGERFYKFANGNHGGQIGAIAVNLFNLPVSLIVQADRGARQFVDPTFVGIGTDLNVVVQALNGARYGE